MTEISANGQQFDVSCVVFDKDGTLLDFDYTWGPRTANWIRALAAATPGGQSNFAHFAKAIGYDWDSKKVLPDGPIAVTTAQKLVTLAAGALFQDGLPWHEAEQQAFNTIIDAFGTPIQSAEVQPVGDVIGAIRRMKNAGLLLAVITGDNRKPTNSTLSLLGIAEDISAVVCGDDPLPEKPDPEALLHVGRQFNLSPDQMLMVGDTVNDMLTGRNAGVAGCIGITGSTGNPEKLAVHADVVLSSIDQLKLVNESP